MLTTLVIAVAITSCAANVPQANNDSIRVLSWNISGDAFVSKPREFRSLLRWANPDVVLLDEVAPTASEDELRKSLDDLRPDAEERTCLPMCWNNMTWSQVPRRKQVNIAPC